MKCKFEKDCGGCVGLEKDYEELLVEKTNDIKNIFSSLDAKVHKCVGNFYPYKYRNKVHLVFHELKGKMLIGFFKDGSSKVVDINGCMLFDNWLNKLVAILKEWVSRFKLRAVNSYNGGVLKYAHARCVEDNIQLSIVATTDNFAGRDWLLKKLQENFKTVSLYLNVNRRSDNMVLGGVSKFVGGEKFLKFNFLSFKISIEPNSFLQVNLPIAQKMYKKALSLLQVNENTTVIDLYSGIGITSMLFAKNCKKVISCEEVVTAVNNAKYMAKINDVKNIEFKTGKCEDVIGQISTNNYGDLVVFVDPARAGLDIKVIDAIKSIKPRNIVYMSCNPDTAYRDIKHIINDNNYRFSDIYPYDMFSFTKHVEILVCLQRQE